MKEPNLKQKILELVEEYYHSDKKDKKSFVPGKTLVPYAGRVFDSEEMINLVSSALDFWLTLGPWGNRFEKALAQFVGVQNALLVNSGSSANLVAFASLLSHKLERPLKKGDEVITVAAGFPTTLNPILQYDCVPVLVDVEGQTLLPKPEWLEAAISPKTRALFLPHTLGNVFDLDYVLDICKRHHLYLIEDNCDAFDSEYRGKKTGSFGDLSTLSMYPPHHMTTGEGGAIFTNSQELAGVVQSIRDWGKDCWCAPGVDNTCGKRFGWQLGDLPLGYDHKYIFSHIGYNLKPTDLQAAIGVAQLKKIPQFTAMRRKNYLALASTLEPYQKWLSFIKATSHSNPSWFMFFMMVSPSAPFTRAEIVDYLEQQKIQTRMLFGGNLMRQPAYKNVKHRLAMTLENTDAIMHCGFGVGIYPGITAPMLDYMIETFKSFLNRY